MKTGRWLLCVGLILFGSVVAVRGNPPPPPSYPMQGGPFPVEMVAVDDKNESRVEIGSDLLSQLSAQANSPQEGPGADVLNHGEGNFIRLIVPRSKLNEVLQKPFTP